MKRSIDKIEWVMIVAFLVYAILQSMFLLNNCSRQENNSIVSNEVGENYDTDYRN